MGKKEKKRRIKASTEEEENEEMEVDAVDVTDEKAEVDTEEVATPVEEDYQKEFTVLGHQDYKETKAIRVVSGWIQNATEFPAAISGSPLGEIDSGLLAEPLFSRVAEQLQHWFPVQRAVIPALLASTSLPPVLRRRDIAISAPTGSGKTLCYVIPLLAAVSSPSATITALVVAPVQALVKQIIEEFGRFNAAGFKLVGLSGAEPYEKERRRLLDEKGERIDADIVVATPSRLVEHMLDPGAKFDLSRLRYIVADEADRMNCVRQEWLELVESWSGGLVPCSSIMDFAMRREAPQKILLSATLSRDVEQLQKWNLHRPRLFRASATLAQQVDTSAECVLPTSIRHTVIEAPLKYHPLVLFREINASTWKRILVFTNQRDSSLRLCKLLSVMAEGKFEVEQLSAGLFGKRRFKVLQRFKQTATRVLICSDILSRGVDVSGVDCVVNYDLPGATRLFIHRAGRTGRAGQAGCLLSIAEKQPKRLYVKMLKKGGLWREGDSERVQEEAGMAEDCEEYKKALDKVRVLMAAEKDETAEEEPRGRKRKARR